MRFNSLTQTKFEGFILTYRFRGPSAPARVPPGRDPAAELLPLVVQSVLPWLRSSHRLLALERKVGLEKWRHHSPRLGSLRLRDKAEHVTYGKVVGQEIENPIKVSWGSLKISKHTKQTPLLRNISAANPLLYHFQKIPIKGSWVRIPVIRLFFLL